MRPYALPDNERERLHLLHDLNIIETEADPAFDRITLLAKDLFNVEAALITLIDKDQQWFFSKVGIEGECTTREASFCTHVVAAGRTMVVEDTTHSDIFHDHPEVIKDGGIRFYAGAPITLFGEFHMGTLCLVDSKPRAFSKREQRWLEALAFQIADTLTTHYELDNYRAERNVLAQGPVCAVIWQIEPEVRLSYVAENAKRVLGYDDFYLLDPEVNYESIVHPDDRQELLERMQLLIDGKQLDLAMHYRLSVDNEAGADERWVYHFARADQDNSGKVLRIRGYLLDESERKQLELQVQRANQRFDLALRASKLGTWDWNLAEGHMEVSSGWQEVIGEDGEVAIGNNWFDLIHPGDVSQTKAALIAHLKGHAERFESRFRLLRASGDYLWIDSIGRAVASQNGRVTRMVGIYHDISEKVKSEEQREQQAKILELVSNMQHDFMLAKDFSEVCDFALPELMEMTNSSIGLVGELPPKEHRRRNLLQIHGLKFGDKDEQIANQQLVQQGLEVEVQGDIVKSVLSRGSPEICDEKVSHLELRLSPINIPEFDNVFLLPLHFKNEVVGIMLLANTNSHYHRAQLKLLQPMLDTLGTLMHVRRIDEERQEVLARLQEMATTDDLTGVANRRVFIDAAEQRFDEFKRYDATCSVAIVDIDFFKKVNDSYGHAAGDDALKAFCQSAQAELRDLDLLGRLGGEEFAILLPYTDGQQAFEAMERVRKAIAAQTITSGEHTFKMTVSAGITQVSADDKAADQWFARADKALYQAKHQGRNRCLLTDSV